MDKVLSDVPFPLIARTIGRYCLKAAGNGNQSGGNSKACSGRGIAICGRRMQAWTARDVKIPVAGQALHGVDRPVVPAWSFGTGPLGGNRACTTEDRLDRRQEGSMRRRISVLLVDPMRLMRDCLAQLLRSGAGDIDVHGVASLEEAAPGSAVPDIILINAMPKRAFLASVEQHVVQLWPGVPVLVIYDENTALPQGESIRTGMAGVFPASLGATVLIATIRVILAHSNAGLGLPGVLRE